MSANTAGPASPASRRRRVRQRKDNLLSVIHATFGGITAVYVVTASIPATAIAAASVVALAVVILFASR